MAKNKCIMCRKTGQKLFLKEEKCMSHKCALARKSTTFKKRKGRQKPVSEYGRQLKEKQALKFLYGLRERQFANYIKKAVKAGGTEITGRLVELLESRLDNTVFRLGFAKSRSAARQMVGHGHIFVNGRRVDIPSRQMKKGDKISIRPQSVSKKLFTDIDMWLKKYVPPDWLKLDTGSKMGEIVKTPNLGGTDLGLNLNAIIEFYSR